MEFAHIVSVGSVGTMRQTAYMTLRSELWLLRTIEIATDSPERVRDTITGSYRE